ncbi:hypothetical protein IAT38_003907 [Cryptococcus sp. DSM 104549]
MPFARGKASHVKDRAQTTQQYLFFSEGRMAVQTSKGDDAGQLPKATSTKRKATATPPVKKAKVAGASANDGTAVEHPSAPDGTAIGTSSFSDSTSSSSTEAPPPESILGEPGEPDGGADEQGRRRWAAPKGYLHQAQGDNHTTRGEGQGRGPVIRGGRYRRGALHCPGWRLHRHLFTVVQHGHILSHRSRYKLTALQCSHDKHVLREHSLGQRNLRVRALGQRTHQPEADIWASETAATQGFPLPQHLPPPGLPIRGPANVPHLDPAQNLALDETLLLILAYIKNRPGKTGFFDKFFGPGMISDAWIVQTVKAGLTPRVKEWMSARRLPTFEELLESTKEYSADTPYRGVYGKALVNQGWRDRTSRSREHRRDYDSKSTTNQGVFAALVRANRRQYAELYFPALWVDYRHPSTTKHEYRSRLTTVALLIEEIIAVYLQALTPARLKHAPKFGSPEWAPGCSSLPTSESERKAYFGELDVWGEIISGVGGGEEVLVGPGFGRGFQCADCGKSFIEKGKLNKHAMIHGERTHLCQEDTCDSAFKTESALLGHWHCHDEEKRYTCGKCSLQYTWSHSCKFDQPKPRPFTCVHTDCAGKGEGFVSNGKLNAHVNKNIHTQTAKKNFKCSLCIWWFKTENLKATHEASYHSPKEPK